MTDREEHPHYELVRVKGLVDELAGTDAGSGEKAYGSVAGAYLAILPGLSGERG